MSGVNSIFQHSGPTRYASFASATIKQVKFPGNLTQGFCNNHWLWLVTVCRMSKTKLLNLLLCFVNELVIPFSMITCGILPVNAMHSNKHQQAYHEGCSKIKWIALGTVERCLAKKKKGKRQERILILIWCIVW